MTDIEKKAYEAYPPVWKKMCGDGEFDIMGERRDGYIKCAEEYESLPKIHGWVARDKTGELYFHNIKPCRASDNVCWYNGFGWNPMDESAFPEITWNDEPIEVELLIRKITK